MKLIDLREEPEHIDQLAEWHHKEWAYLHPDGSLAKRKEEMRGYLSEELVPSTYIAKENNELLGSAAILRSDMDSHPEYTPWLASVYVAQKFRCRGIGSKLVKHVMQQASEAGISELFLFTPSEENFYENIGWQTLARETYQGSLVTIMSIKLSHIKG